ncbi:hypothetical protein [Actinomadura sp. 6N118]
MGVHRVRPEDVAAELRRDSDEQLAQALDKLVGSTTALDHR